MVLMPPTLVASIYGMNFKHMPELEWIGGYPFALLADAARRRASVPVFQVAEVVVSWAPRGAHTIYLWDKGARRHHTCWPPLMWISAPFT